LQYRGDRPSITNPSAVLRTAPTKKSRPEQCRGKIRLRLTPSIRHRAIRFPGILATVLGAFLAAMALLGH
jgi:hypothetical protein